MGWDNTQKGVQCKHQSRKRENKFVLVALTYAVSHRTPSLHLPDNDCKPATEIALSSFLPTPSEWNNIKERMINIVERILTEHVPALQELKSMVLQHVPHEQSASMSRKSCVINLGTVSANPATTAGTIEIMSYLHKYVPKKENGDVHPIVTNGDQMTVERMTHAKRGRVRAATAEHRLEGLVESIQEFHKEGLLLQVVNSLGTKMNLNYLES